MAKNNSNYTLVKVYCNRYTVRQIDKLQWSKSGRNARQIAAVNLNKTDVSILRRQIPLYSLETKEEINKPDVTV